ncbi:dynamin family protein [Litoreibacter roseus]|nr:dynamin family protein [Litoreibacter roseus]
MNMDDVIEEDYTAVDPALRNVFKRGLEGMAAFAAKLSDFEDALENLSVLADEETQKKLSKLQLQMEAVQPSVTVIGQIKAGKTSLVNAMIGSPDLLPADVNPWTSVVTSLHINTPDPDPASRAKFKFFDETEWDRLVEDGGRIGELAARAGADDELEKVRAQIAQMRDKTRARLGRKFELLLGQEHKYGYIDDDLIQRYVCLGDDPIEGEETDNQGQFADITKSADLYIERPDMPLPLCIRDTPGVNDTFMMREQITINAIRDSRICVVVLSAHQALTSMDMALIRLISNVKSREIIVFVNRIDELPDPATQVPEIRDSIIQTLKKNNGPADSEIIFGSAYWANMAMLGTLEAMHGESAKSLDNWSATLEDVNHDRLTPEELAWEASGIPAFYRALAERVDEGAGQDAIQKAARKAMNIATGLRATNQVTLMRSDRNGDAGLQKDQVVTAIDEIEQKFTQQLSQDLSKAIGEFNTRVDQSHGRFLERATASLIDHLEKKGADEIWQYSPMGLRLLLRSSYQVISKKASIAGETAYQGAAEALTEIYATMFNVSVDGFTVKPALVPHIAPPVSLGQTIALDLQTGWWKGWWRRRRGYKAFAEDFYKLIEAETNPIVEDLKGPHAAKIRTDCVATLSEFFVEQRAILMDVLEKSNISDEDLDELFGVKAQEEQALCLDVTMDELAAFAA